MRIEFVCWELWRRKEKERERGVRGELSSQVVVPGAV